ncbi:nitroreductase family protein [Chryseobacterium sp. C-71]|uniref:nitroreductase family protein n=1 Tax=Chryseobacterium sp. C-71 TaxID=2893882 RepID=UPI001E5A903C|nr:nitroreductase family protein [Chryseobacterium sp. C-71]UFH33576.1 nitroreductase family protein [Chryseobacterium sp. C-71]
MSFLDKIKNRYTVKKYNPQAKISQEKIDELKAILNLSPSSINSQPWNFVFIKTQNIKEQLSKFSYHNKQKVIDCSHVIVFQVLKSSEHFENQMNDYLNEVGVNFYNTLVKPNGEECIKSWMTHQVYLSLGVFLSACADMEIDSTPMEGIQSDQYDAIINNLDYKSVFAVAIGEKSEDDKNQLTITPKRRLDSEKIIVEL